MADNITRTEKELVFRTAVAASDAVMDRFHLKEKEDSVEIEKGVKAAALISSLATRNVFKKTFDDVYTKIRSVMTDSIEEKLKTAQVVQPEISSRVIRVSRERKEKIEEKVNKDVALPSEKEQIERVDIIQKTNTENRVFAQSSDYEDVQREKRATEEWVDLGEANDSLEGFLTFWDPRKLVSREKKKDISFVQKLIIPAFAVLFGVFDDLGKKIKETSFFFDSGGLSEEGGGEETGLEDLAPGVDAIMQTALHNAKKTAELDESVREQNAEVFALFDELGVWITTAVKSGEHATRTKLDTRTKTLSAKQIDELQKEAYARGGARAVYEFDVAEEKQRKKAEYLLEKGYTVQPTAKSEEAQLGAKEFVSQISQKYKRQLRVEKEGEAVLLKGKDEQATAQLREKFNEHLDWYLENTKGESLVTQTKKIANYFAESDRRLYSTIQRKHQARPTRIERPEQAKAVPVRQAKPADRAQFVTAEPTVKKRQPERAKVEQKKLELPKRKEVVKKNFVELPVEQRQGEQQEITVPNELTPYFDQMADIINSAADSLNRR